MFYFGAGDSLLITLTSSLPSAKSWESNWVTCEVTFSIAPADGAEELGLEDSLQINLTSSLTSYKSWESNWVTCEVTFSIDPADGGGGGAGEVGAAAQWSATKTTTIRAKKMILFIFN